MKKKVIDGDKMVILEYFAPEQSDKILGKYSNLGIYEDIAFDCDGDLILYREF